MSRESKPKVYCIHIKEKVDSSWASWLGELEVEYTSVGESLISGPFIDQTALHSLLERIRDFNWTLISVNQVENWEDD
ncbi:MAG: hypothetical protein PVF74_04480 [Anaerolineales bacterium]